MLPKSLYPSISIYPLLWNVIDVEGYKLFGNIPEDQLSYGYRPWGKENTLFIGWTYFTYNLEGETLTMSNGVDIDGPVYVYKRLRK